MDNSDGTDFPPGLVPPEEPPGGGMQPGKGPTQGNSDGEDETLEEGGLAEPEEMEPKKDVPNELANFLGVDPEEMEEPIEERASEAEKLYANLLIKTDFSNDFIEEMLEFEPDEESWNRIDELVGKRQMVRESGPPAEMIMAPPMAPMNGMM